MSIDLAVVPVAGRGTRLLPLTKSQPKEMLPVGDKPVVQFVVEELEVAEIQRLVFVTGPGKTAIENHFDTDDSLIQHLRENGCEELLATLAFERKKIEYFYTRQRRQLGLGHAVLCAQPFVKDQPFVVALGDTIIGRRGNSQVVKRLITTFEDEKADGVILFETVSESDVSRYGIAAVRQNRPEYFELEDLVEKPPPDAAPSNYAVASRYVFRPEIFSHLAGITKGKGNEIQLTDAISTWIRDGGRILGVLLPQGERRYDIGNFASYYRAFIDFAMSDSEHGSELMQHLRQQL